MRSPDDRIVCNLEWVKVAVCNAISSHKLTLTRDARIKCEKCWGQWDLEGRELVPTGFPSWAAWRDDRIKNNLPAGYGAEAHWSGRNSLAPRDIAKLLVRELIVRNKLRDRAEIRALKQEASQSPEVFIDQVLGRTQP